MAGQENSDPDNSRSALSKAYQELGPYLGIGIQFMLSLFLCIILGYWLDDRYETSPLFILIGVFLGMFAGFYNLFKTVSRLDKKDNTSK